MRRRHATRHLSKHPARPPQPLPRRRRAPPSATASPAARRARSLRPSPPRPLLRRHPPTWITRIVPGVGSASTPASFAAASSASASMCSISTVSTSQPFANAAIAAASRKWPTSWRAATAAGASGAGSRQRMVTPMLAWPGGRQGRGWGLGWFRGGGVLRGVGWARGVGGVRAGGGGGLVLLVACDGCACAPARSHRRERHHAPELASAEDPDDGGAREAGVAAGAPGVAGRGDVSVGGRLAAGGVGGSLRARVWRARGALRWGATRVAGGWRADRMRATPLPPSLRPAAMGDNPLRSALSRGGGRT